MELPQSPLTPAVPEFWTYEVSNTGAQILSHAVRSGGTRWMLIAAGLALVAVAGPYIVWWFLRDDGTRYMTVFGWALLVLMAGAIELFGVHMLGRMLWARTDYVLDQGMIATDEISSFFQRRHTEVQRNYIVAVVQSYTPPQKGDPRRSPGRWATSVQWRAPGEHDTFLDFDGMKTEAEARWLGRVLTQWAKVPLKRGFGASVEDEADPAEYPGDPEPQ